MGPCVLLAGSTAQRQGACWAWLQKSSPGMMPSQACRPSRPGTPSKDWALDLQDRVHTCRVASSELCQYLQCRFLCLCLGNWAQVR